MISFINVVLDLDLDSEDEDQDEHKCRESTGRAEPTSSIDFVGRCRALYDYSIFYEIYIKYPPYSFIWPYSFNWPLRL